MGQVMPAEAVEDLAMELFIGDNFNQSREASIADWRWLHEHGYMRGRTEHYKAMATHVLANGYGKVGA